MLFRLRRYAVPLLAIAVYLLLAVCFVKSGVGLEEDEAISFRRAALIAEGAYTPCLLRFDIKARNLCLPVMLWPYVGATKDYVFLPLFAAAGFHVSVARMGAALLASIGIFGVWFLTEATSGAVAAAVAAGFLALNPTYLDMPLFDQGNVAVSLGALGLISIAVVRGVRAPSHRRFFLLGLWIGIGIWGRLNLAWLVAAGALAVLAVYRRELLRFARYAPAFLLGALTGAAPLLKYLAAHGRDLTQFMASAAVPLTFAQKLRDVATGFADVLLASREHRVGIWHAKEISLEVSLCLAALVVAALCYCAIQRRRPARTLAVTVAVLSLIFLSSALPVAAHHQAVLLPLLAIPLGIFLPDFWRSRAAGRALCCVVVFAYISLASVIDVRTIRDLNRSGGYGEWSSSVDDLVAQLERNNASGALYLLDWGFKDPLLLLSHGRLQGDELFWKADESSAREGLTWSHLIHSGGRFVTYAAANLHIAEATIQFERALHESGKRFQKFDLQGRDGSAYASIYLVPPSTGPEPPSPPAVHKPETSFFASPADITASDRNGLAKATLYFWTNQSPYVEIHVNAPTGNMLGRYRCGQQSCSGAAVTENWVKDGTTFFLQDVAGKPLTAEHTLAIVKVSVHAPR